MFAHIIPGGSPATSTFYHTITSNVNGINLWNVVVAANGGSTPSQGNIEVTINAGVEIGAINNTSGYAIDVPSDFASNSKTLTIINNGYVGGFGGNGGEYDVSVPGTGGNGGTAINFNSNATLINNGTLAGGGGGGGGGIGSASEPGGPTFYADGGGGAGLPFGTAGGGYPSGGIGASDGTKTAGGLASLAILDDENPGGDGGNRGQAGQNGDATGGAAGYPYQENTGITVTFTNSGTVYGSPILS